MINNVYYYEVLHQELHQICRQFQTPTFYAING
jgi:hypothetical protein